MSNDYKKRLLEDEELRKEVCARFEPDHFKALSDKELRAEFKKHRKSLDDIYPADKRWKQNDSILSTVFNVIDNIVNESKRRNKLDEIINKLED